MTEPILDIDTHLVKTRLIALLHASKKSNESRMSLKKFEALKEDLIVLGSLSSTKLLEKECKQSKEFLEENRLANDTSTSHTAEDPYLYNHDHKVLCRAYYSSGITNEKKRKRNNCYGIIENTSREDCLSPCNSDRSWCADKFLYSPVSSPEYSFLEEECNHDDKQYMMEKNMTNSIGDYDRRQQRSFIIDRDEAFSNPYSPIRCNYDLDKDVQKNV